MNCSNMQRDLVMGSMTPQLFTSVHASECCHSVSYVTYKPFEYVAFITVWNSSQVIPCISASFTGYMYADCNVHVIICCVCKRLWNCASFKCKIVSSSEFYVSFIFVRPEVITAVNRNILTSWNVMPCSLVGTTVLVYLIASIFRVKSHLCQILR
jgi:hypothetical protein